MKRIDNIHPIVLFFYFLIIIFISMFMVNPIMILISFVSSLLLYAELTSFKKMIKLFLGSLVFILLMALINPIFSRNGSTVLFTVRYYKFTLESMLYGFFTTMMLTSVIIWFASYSLVFKSDKFIYLFGKIIPKTSLVLSVTLNFIPRFTRYFKEVDDAQRALGVYNIENKGLINKIKMKMRVFSIVLGMGLESSIDTSDSMKARGYGLASRSNYSIFKWKISDYFLGIFWLIISFIIIIFIVKIGDYNYYPSMDKFNFDYKSIILYSAFFILTISGTILEIKENILWHYLKSKN